MLIYKIANLLLEVFGLTFSFYYFKKLIHMNFLYKVYFTVCSLILCSSFFVLYCTIKCDSGLKYLRIDSGALNEIGWYEYQPARELFHGSLRYESEVVYWSPITLICIFFIAIVMCFLGKKFNFSYLSVYANLLSLLLVAFTFFYYYETRKIVSIIVD